MAIMSSFPDIKQNARLTTHDHLVRGGKTTACRLDAAFDDNSFHKKVQVI
jgi:hypothetical protein